MQDLALQGLLGAPHVSAGRLPTHAGLRLFVDGLLEVGDVGEEERRTIEARLHAHGRNFEDALNEASVILSGLAGGAAWWSRRSATPASSMWSSWRLGVERTLAVMVFADGTVENPADPPDGRGDAFGPARGLQLPQHPPARAHPQ